MLSALHTTRVQSPSCKPTSNGRRTPLPIRAAAAAAGQTTDGKATELLDTLRRAAKAPGSVRHSDVLSAVLALEKMKLKPDGWVDALTAPGTCWRLVYTISSKDVVAASKGKKGGSGGFFPLSACQKFEGGVFENGIFLGPVGHFTFKGPYKTAGRNLYFDVTTMGLGLGPWRLSLPLKKEVPLEGMEPREMKKLPFFIYAHIGDDLVVARGRSGGLAFWARADAEWLAGCGALAVYG